MISFGPPKDPAARREWWRRQIQRQQDGSVSVAEFCRRLGVRPVRFYAWRRRLQAAPAGARLSAGNGRAHRKPTPNAVPTPAFMPVSLLDSGPSGQLEVALGNACVVRLQGAVDPELLRVAIGAAGRLERPEQGGD